MSEQIEVTQADIDFAARWANISQAKCECHDFEHRRARTSWHYQIKDRRVLGATLSWDMKAVPYEETDLECDWCGRQFSRRGYLPGLLWRLSYPPDYDGWPTLDGVRLPVWPPLRRREVMNDRDNQRLYINLIIAFYLLTWGWAIYQLYF